jgi:hypothetical protein
LYFDASVAQFSSMTAVSANCGCLQSVARPN